MPARMSDGWKGDGEYDPSEFVGVDVRRRLMPLLAVRLRDRAENDIA